MANASSEISGSVIECIVGITMPVSVGNISFCVIGKLSKSLQACLLWIKFVQFLQMSCLNQLILHARMYLMEYWSLGMWSLMTIALVLGILLFMMSW